jgi:Aspartyl/Asparaginyl beta-hydroxylase
MSIGSFREQVEAAARHEGGIKLHACLALEPSWFSAIQDDVRRLLRQRSPSDVTATSHPTHWTNPYGKATQYSLFNASGDTADTSVDHNHQHEGKSFNASECHALRRFFACFETRALNLRLNGLLPDSGLSPHEEFIVHGDRLRLRFHLPIFTSDTATVVLDEERFHLQPGLVYYFNNGCVHAAENAGREERYHLLWDLFLDEWIYENVLDLDARAVPDPGLRKLTRAEAAAAMVAEPCPIDEYIVGTPTGELLQARRVRDENGRQVWVRSRMAQT